jgi:hypothetical protein
MKQPPVIDIHAHYYPESYLQVLVQDAGIHLD